MPNEMRALLYVIDGDCNAQVPIPPGHSVVAFAHGTLPRLLALNQPGDIGYHELGTIVLAAIPDHETCRWLAMDQDEADDLHARVLSDWARQTSLGSA
jgi:hypothetical protein